MAICKKCRQDLPESKFSVTRRKLASGEYKDYINSTCMVCYRQSWLMSEKNRETHRKGNRNWYYNNPEHAKTQRLRKYGIDYDEYNRMRESQQYKCAVCDIHETKVTQGRAKTPATALQVDHCHATGSLRKLLCTDCNIILGKSKDNPEILKAAALYLESFIKEKENE